MEEDSSVQENQDPHSLSNYCRVCGSPHYGNAVAIFDEYGNYLQLSEKINSYLPITVSIDDERRLFVCSQCVEKLNVIHEVITSCIEADATFTEILQVESGKIKPDEAISVCEERNLHEVELDDYQNIKTGDIVTKDEAEDEDDAVSNGNEVNIDFQDRVLELCFTEQAADEGKKSGSKSPVLDSQISKLLGVVDNGTELKIVEGVQSFASRGKESPGQASETSESLQCNICEFVGSSSNELSAHVCQRNVKQKHSDNLCKFCNKKFKDTYKYNIHKQSHRRGSFACPQCGKVFTRYDPLFLTHQMGHEGVKPHHCKHCDKRFVYRCSLEIHLLNVHSDAIHLGVRPFQCSVCSVSFIRKGDLNKHYKSHVTDNVMCRICKATFPSVAWLLNHRKSHSADEWEIQQKGNRTPSFAKNFHCNVCNKFLSSKLSLSLHMRGHTGEKPYQCEVCNKRFTQKPALTYHMRLHTGERPHACQFCGKRFNSKGGKESHERTHTGERPYKCGQCGVGFRCSANLRQHTVIHTDNRPFVCEVCSKLFRRREALQVHMRIHTGERPYSCPICGRKFTQKGDMLKHSRTHSKKSRPLEVSGAREHEQQVFVQVLMNEQIS